MRIKTVCRLMIFIAIMIVTASCSSEQGDEFMNWMVWAGNNATLLTVILVAITPVIAAIPGVGVPVSFVIANAGTWLIPMLKDAARAIEQDDNLNRSIGESASAIVGKLADDRDSLVGKIPGVGLAANIAAASVVRRARRLKKKTGLNAWPNF